MLVREFTLSDFKQVDDLLSSTYAGFTTLENVSDILYFQGKYPHVSLVAEDEEFIGHIFAIEFTRRKPLLFRKVKGKCYELKCFLMRPKYWRDQYLSEIMDWFLKKLEKYFVKGIVAEVELHQIEAVEFLFRSGMRIHEVSYFKPVEKKEQYFKPTEIEDVGYLKDFELHSVSDYKLSEEDLKKHTVFYVNRENEGKCLVIVRKENDVGRITYLAVSRNALSSGLFSKVLDSIVSELYYLGAEILVLDCLVEKREFRRYLRELGFYPFSYFLYMVLRDQSL